MMGVTLAVIVDDDTHQYRADAYAAFRASRLMRFWAAVVEDAGFWPVTRRPSTTENGCQSATFSKIAPSRSSSSSTRKGTTCVSWTAASSPFVKPVTRLPFTSGSPLYV